MRLRQILDRRGVIDQLGYSTYSIHLSHSQNGKHTTRHDCIVESDRIYIDLNTSLSSFVICE